MYGLNQQVDLSFLSDRKLLQVCVGEFQVILRFDGDTTITLECAFGYTPKSGQKLLGVPSSQNSAACLLGLVGLQVMHVNNLGNGNLEIVLTNRDRVEIYDSNADTESYQISSPRGMIIV